jgi:hypothetical protein
LTHTRPLEATSNPDLVTKQTKLLLDYIDKIVAHKCKLCFKLILCDTVLLDKQIRHFHQTTLDEYSKELKCERIYSSLADKQTILDNAEISSTPKSLCTFKCLSCNKTYGSYQALLKHITENRNHGPLIKPIWINHIIKPVFYECHICTKKVFCDANYLENHFRESHKMTLKEYRQKLWQETAMAVELGHEENPDCDARINSLDVSVSGTSSSMGDRDSTEGEFDKLDATEVDKQSQNVPDSSTELETTRSTEASPATRIRRETKKPEADLTLAESPMSVPASLDPSVVISVPDELAALAKRRSDKESQDSEGIPSKTDITMSVRNPSKETKSLSERDKQSPSQHQAGKSKYGKTKSDMNNNNCGLKLYVVAEGTLDPLTLEEAESLKTKFDNICAKRSKKNREAIKSKRPDDIEKVPRWTSVGNEEIGPNSYTKITFPRETDKSWTENWLEQEGFGWVDETSELPKWHTMSGVCKGEEMNALGIDFFRETVQGSLIEDGIREKGKILVKTKVIATDGVVLYLDVDDEGLRALESVDFTIFLGSAGGVVFSPVAEDDG